MSTEFAGMFSPNKIEKSFANIEIEIDKLILNERASMEVLSTNEYVNVEWICLQFKVERTTLDTQPICLLLLQLKDESKKQIKICTNTTKDLFTAWLSVSFGCAFRWFVTMELAVSDLMYRRERSGGRRGRQTAKKKLSAISAIYFLWMLWTTTEMLRCEPRRLFMENRYCTPFAYNVEINVAYFNSSCGTTAMDGISLFLAPCINKLHITAEIIIKEA